MKTTALAGWFGSNRTLAPLVGKHLAGMKWIGVPFCGGCCELAYLKPRSGVAADVHRHILNLARVVREPQLKDALAARLDSTLFHPDELAAAQRRCGIWEQNTEAASGLFSSGKAHDGTPSVNWAYDYFICCWMGRGGNAGTDSEFTQGMSVRWNANGGDSCTRFRSAADSLDAWTAALKPWNFVTQDCFEFLDNASKDDDGHGLYCDPPWPGPGDKYTHRFGEAQQRRLADVLGAYARTRVVIRFGDHPLIRELYPSPQWKWIEQTSKGQAGNDVNEVLILNRAASEATA